MKDPRRFVLYRHIRPDKDEPFYIGIGTIKRAYQTDSERNKHWVSIYNLNNKNIHIEILQDELTWQEAQQREVWWIKYYGRKDKKEGTLCNMTDGGEGAYGRVVTESQIAKFKKSRGSKPHPMLGKTHTPEAKAKIAEASRTRVYGPEYGRKISEGKLKSGKYVMTERGLSERERRKGCAVKGSRKVIDNNTGVIYDCIAHAARTLNIKQTTLARWLKGERKNTTTLQFLN